MCRWREECVGWGEECVGGGGDCLVDVGWFEISL